MSLPDNFTLSLFIRTFYFMIKHFTSTVFIVHNQKIALHWHKKVCEWLPAGGHIDKNETPVEAGIREVNEEMGIEVKIISNSNYNFDEIETVPVPEAILIESVRDDDIGEHQHIDFVYFGVPINDSIILLSDWIWISADELISELKLTNSNGLSKSPPEDVIKLGLQAIKKLSV
ncbi:MAG: NUDIX domain-containing protein [SAR202 cluster bacterium]|nr:MAG: NUDIX domain-containing protein [SAR202 cluster bacterium]KAA1299459.1 MAG: NUDIX domain-containing protein [SAR202 cluster bacterium]MQG12227.1 NUDIX domain-containing protein [SAR202 cluster bacterium]